MKENGFTCKNIAKIGMPMEKTSPYALPQGHDGGGYPLVAVDNPFIFSLVPPHPIEEKFSEDSQDRPKSTIIDHASKQT